ncbi:uncharacterized protein JCM6883_001393 [Sporobolomyces salmoneus]|uniref:uncharacterized protein n=1 Tax=Sporobolomyces salmoneus TaxID=183962 RepID=UPI003181812B
MDHLSRLPKELLDYVLELAALDSELTTLAISKYLLLSQERAIHQAIAFDASTKFPQLLDAFDFRPDKGRYVKKFGWRWWRHVEPEFNVEELLRHLPNLFEMTLDNLNEASVPPVLKEPALFPSLRVCRLPNVPLNCSIVDGMSRIPTLRLIKVCSVSSEEEEENFEWKPALQVLQISTQSASDRFTFPIPQPSRLFRFFPNASISSVHLQIFNDYSVLPLFDALDTNLLSLHLEGADVDLHDQIIDDLLPRFSHLRHLHLDHSFISGTLQTYLLDLPNLVSLSLGWWDQDPPTLDTLLAGLERLPHLRELKFTYLGIVEGFQFDFEDAETVFRGGYLQTSDDEPQPFDLLNRIDNLEKMQDWSIPWSWTISTFIDQLSDMVDKAEAAGLIVESNLEDLIWHLELQIVECYNRAVGELYSNNRRKPLRYALSLLEKHGLDAANRLEIDLDNESFDYGDLKWFQVKVDELDGLCKTGYDGCYVYGLRMKTQSEYTDSDEEEEDTDSEDDKEGKESDGSEESSGESKDD